MYRKICNYNRVGLEMDRLQYGVLSCRVQNIDYSVYEASRIDGASPFQQFTKITIPLLKPTILLTAIMSTSGTLQLFDESVNLTAGGPGKSTMTLTHYIYNISFVETPKFNYAAKTFSVYPYYSGNFVCNSNESR